MVFGKLVNKYYLKYGLIYLIGIATLVIIDYLQLKIPLILLDVVDGLQIGNLTSEILLKQVFNVIIIVVCVVIGRFVWRQCILGGSRKIEFDIRQELFSHQEKLSQDFYSKNKTGALMAYYTNDIETIRNSFSFGVVMVVDAIVMSVITLYQMIKLDSQMAILAFLPLLIISLIGIKYAIKLEAAWDKRQVAYEKISDFITENFYGISVIKAFVKQREEYVVFTALNDENRKSNVDFSKKNALINSLVNFTIYIILVLILFYGGYKAFKDGNFSAGLLVAFVAYFNSLLWPILSIPDIVVYTSQGKASLKRLTKLMDEKITVKDDELTDNSLNKISGDLVIKNLNFSYSDDKKLVLKNINLHIEKGRRVGIIGKTGCGKSTLVELLLRVYNSKEGEIKIGENDIRNIPLKVLRENISYVPQDGFLFSDTISRNISFGTKNKDIVSVQEAAKNSSVHTNIEDFKEKYETIVGERGVTLSGGQKQRVAIARAIIKDPEILILDDSVSAVDTSTEEEILRNLSKIRTSKTTILIAHRISTIIDSDIIVVMDKGEIVGTGTHDYLTQNCTIYNEIFEKQRLDELIGGE